MASPTSRADHIRARRSVILLAALVMAGIFMVVVAGHQPASHSLSSRTRAIASELRCPICQGESVNDSPSGLAQAMREMIRRQLASGQTDAQVKQFFVQRYGEWILLAPPASGIGAVVWLAPLALVGFGIIGLCIVAVRWSRATRRASSVAIMEPEEMAAELDLFGRQVEDGSISPAEYALRTAELESNRGSLPPTRPIQSSHTGRNVLGLAAGAAAVAVAMFLAIQPRGTAAITGTVPGQNQSMPTIAPNQPWVIKRAEQFAMSHPRSVSAWVNLGTALIVHHEVDAARLSFLTALRLESHSQRARLALAAVDIGQGHNGEALRLLAPVGRAHPNSARFWLLSGMAESKFPGRLSQALVSWRRFLVINPTGPIAAEVRQLIQRATNGTGR